MPSTPQEPIRDPDHLLPPHRKPIGPFAAILIILILLVFGAVYLWKSALARRAEVANMPYLQSSTTTLPTIVSTTTVAR